jgi:hypothetical protein
MERVGAMKLITCIVPAGVAGGVLKKLKQERGIIEANSHNARGIGRMTPTTHRGLGSETPKDVLSVTVAAEAADELFAFLFREANIDRPHGGILFMSALGRATPYALPDVPEEA